LSKTTEKPADTVRVFALAKELKLDNKELIDVCQELGFEKVKNQLNSLTADQADLVRKRVKDGAHRPAPAAPARQPVSAPPAGPPKSLDTKVRNLAPAKPPKPVAVTEPEVAPVPPGSGDGDPPQVTPTETAVAEPTRPEAAEPSSLPVAPPPPAVPSLGKGVANLLNPNRMPNLAARPVGRPQNLNQPRPAAPAPKPVAPPSPAPTAPAGERPAPNPPQPLITPAVPTPAAAAPVEPKPAVPTPAAVPVTPAASTPTPTPSPSPSQQPPRPVLPPNVGGRPMNLASGPRTASAPPGSARPAPNPGPPRTNFPPPNPGAPRPGGFGVSTPAPRSGPPGGPGGPPRPPAPAPAPKGGSGQPMKLTPDQIKKLREREQKLGQRLTQDQVAKTIINEAPGGPDKAGPDRGSGVTRGPDRGPARPGVGGGKDDDGDKKKGQGGAAVSGREGRHAGRQLRDRGRATDIRSVNISGGQAELSEERFGSRKGPRAALLAKLQRQKGRQQVVKKEGPVEITLPITLRTLSEAIGVKLGDLAKQLFKETQQLYGATSQIEFDVAEIIAINKGITLVAKRPKTAKDLLMEKFKEQEENIDPDKLKPRPPIVVIMGHVDHGKTSLLDKIRQEYGLQSDVVSTEAGGITQVLRAWRVEKDGKPVTFLDTPGHEAFTKMRARGANVTDIAVIVVAATDGVMPQTEEAIAHARAAEVDIIVAINKVDMPNANLDKTRRQLYQLNLLPDNMGGDTQFIETSAVTGQGIGELLDAIGIQAELADPPLMADPEHKPSGTCLEAYLDGDKGVMATLMVQQGTLRKGDVILCGAAHGRVRAMFDDLGRPVEEAGPSTPVKVFGLDVVPDADDPFYFVDDITEAAEIAEQERQLIREAELVKFSPVSLDRLREANAKVKITELKVILKAEARGSVEAIKKELEKLVHEEVRCRVLHAGIGAITESDVTLALTSPADTLVIGFNVTADDDALKLAEARGISLREYQIIYNLVDDVKAALEGRLKPVEEVVHLGRAVIRETFKVSKVGTIAGCYVTSGVIERSARVRVIREGTVIYPPPEKTLGLDSLKRFKDDAKEVREGFECGMKITGFDDVKVGDVIEAYRIDIKQRTL
jgi:translation initiation factor IF-2